MRWGGFLFFFSSGSVLHWRYSLESAGAGIDVTKTSDSKGHETVKVTATSGLVYISCNLPPPSFSYHYKYLILYATFRTYRKNGSLVRIILDLRPRIRDDTIDVILRMCTGSFMYLHTICVYVPI